MSLSYQPVGPVVPPTGDPYASLALVGARPGPDEARAGRPFVGRSGDLLWRLSGLSRDDCYVTNLRRDYSSQHATPTAAEAAAALPTLREELLQTRANIFVALGVDAFTALTGLDSLESWRGSVVDGSLVPGRKVLGTWHPAACLYGAGTYNLRYIIEHDIRRAKRQSTFPEIRRPQRTFHINPPFEEAVALLRSLGSRIAVDIETFQDQPNCVGIADSADRAILIPFIGSRYTLSELAFLWRELDIVFRTRESIGQNFQFDVTRLERLGFYFGKIAHDTMLSHHLLWTELGAAFKRKSGPKGIDSLTGRHSLAFIASIYTEEPYYKHESDLAWNTPGLDLGERFWRYWTYCCKDCCVTYESSEKLETELVKYGQKTYFDTKVIPLIRPISRMQSRGLRIDFNTLRKVRSRLQLETRFLQLSLNQEVGFEINVKSTPDIRYLISDVFHLSTVKRTPTGQPSTNEDTIRRLSYNSDHAETFQRILDIRERRTLLSNFLQPDESEDRYHAAYLLHGTSGARLSSQAVRKGPQLQNIPSSIRRMFVPEKGHVFINGDYARAEAMFVAYDARAVKLIQLFEDPSRDLYREVAKDALNRDVAKDSVERHAFKQVVLGANYGLGPDKLVVVLRLHGIDIMQLAVPGSSPRAKATFVLDRYKRAHPEIPRWQADIEQQVKSTRCLHDAFGRRRLFLGPLNPPDDKATIRRALSYRPQSSVGSLTNQAICTLDANNEPVVAQVHDSILGEPTIEDAPRFADAMVRAMTIPIDMHGRQMVLRVGLQWGWNWGDLKEWSDFKMAA